MVRRVELHGLYLVREKPDGGHTQERAQERHSKAGRHSCCGCEVQEAGRGGQQQQHGVQEQSGHNESVHGLPWRHCYRALGVLHTGRL